MKLSKRLQAIHDEIPKGAIVADIGTDHGLLNIAAIQSKRAQFAYALDINEGPLQQAHDNVVRFGLEDSIELVLSDGLKSFTKKADCYVIAGMGSDLIWSIMQDYPFLSEDTIIIQSNTKHYELRKVLSENGFEIIKEIFLMDQGKAVFIQVLKKSKAYEISECDAQLGSYLVKHMDETYLQYLKDRSAYLKTIAHNNTKLNNEYQCILNILEKGARHE